MSELPDFRIHATIFALALNEAGYLRTRYRLLSHIQDHKEEQLKGSATSVDELAR